MPGFTLRIEPREGSPPGEGGLLVRGESVMAGHLGDPAGTARALEGGSLHTGDLVRREPDGSHTFLGRIGEAVKVGGLWVTPSRAQAELIDAGVRRIVESAHDDAVRLLGQNREALDELADALLENETLDEADVYQLAGGRPAPRLVIDLRTRSGDAPAPSSP